MSVKIIVRQQYRRIVDATASHATLQTPPEGWMRTVRKALGMSGAQLAKKMGVTRARVAQAEHAELSGGATLKTMQTAAKAKGCRVVGAASTHMAFESQALPKDKIAKEVERLTREIVKEMPPDFWSDK